ncbi:glucose transporter type 1-like [Lineus longissimus]|uniref:glucose transporter type 1-like n=1 Tax=Lineus longissimus TaxID=88925 RepID=UPI002B4D6A3F
MGTAGESGQILTNRNQQSVTACLLLSIFGATCGALSFGYNTGVINAPQSVIEKFINETQMLRTGSWMQDQTISLLLAITVAIFAVGGMLGGFSAGWWANRFGRRGGMLLNNVFGITAALLMGLSKTANSFEMIIIGRLIVGFCCGIFTGLTPMYLSEVAPNRLRGALGTVNQLGVVIGILISQVLGINEAFGNEKYWSLLLGLSGVPCVLMLISLPFCPESPRYLLITKQLEKEARSALERLRGTTDVQDELEEMQNEAKAEQSEAKVSIIGLLKTTHLRWPLAIAVVMQLSQQLSGINAVFYYSTTIFGNAGLAQSVAAYSSIGVGSVMVVMTLITIPLMDRAGRRTLHLLGLGGMFVFCVLLTLSLCLTFLVPWFKYTTVVCALLYVVFFALGPGSIPWMITAELFSQGPRPAAMSIAVLVNWSCNFLVGLLFPVMLSGLGDYCFIPFIVLLALFWLFTYFKVPETKNKSFEEISNIFRKGSTSKSNEVMPAVVYSDGTAIVEENDLADKL